MGSSPSSPTDDEGDKFWVPPNVAERKRAHSLIPALTHRSSIDDTNSSVATATSLSAMKELAFSLPSGRIDEEAKAFDSPPSPTKLRRRRASMHDAIDFTKIDAKLYENKALDRQQSVLSIQEENHGTVNFSLQYVRETSVLKVKVIQALDLDANRNTGTRDPYCKVSILPRRKQQLRSKIHKRTVNPEFEEEFVFDVPQHDITFSAVEILLFNHDRLSQESCFGRVQLQLENVDLSEKVTLWKHVTPCSSENNAQNKQLGDLMLSLSYLSSAERLTVVIVRARNLTSTEKGKITLDSYVKVALVYAGKKLKRKKTTIKRNTNNPVWNEALVFNLGREFLKHICIDLVVFHDNKLGNDEELGKIHLGPDSKGVEMAHLSDMIVGKNTGTRWHSLAN